MSLRTPMRSQSSLGHSTNPNKLTTPARTNSVSSGNPAQSSNTPPQRQLKPRASLTDLRRPPSARSSYRPASPRMNNSTSSSRLGSRPSSSMSGSYGGSGRSSRPSTPSFIRPDPYTGSISVSIRPNPQSVDQHQDSHWYINETNNSIININDSSEFGFDNVFRADIDVTNRNVYEKSCSKLVQSFLNEGYNSTVFAYGMTGSGKTFSIKGNEYDPGFIKLAVDDIFNKFDNEISSKQYNLSVSYLEIYNEKIIDLLNSGPPLSSDLKIRDDPIYGTKIVGITTIPIHSREQLIHLIDNGDQNRKTSETDFNSRSSRSHAILQLKLNVVDLATGFEQNSTLSLCDLAGSERATSSVERRKEGSFINKSLLALSTVINKLSVSSNTASATDHIPYRDSKLTRLLQPALSGSSLVLILCTIHLGSAGVGHTKYIDNQFVSETYNTLRFAARAKDIVINVQKNKQLMVGDNETVKIIDSLRRTIETQKEEISMLKYNSGNVDIRANAMQVDEPLPIQDNENSRVASVEAENHILTEKLEHLTRLTDLQKTETVILKNDTLNELLGSKIDNSTLQIMIANLEEFYKRVNYEMDEYRSYINHLETLLKQAHESSSLQSGQKANHGLNDRQVEALMKDQEEEIIHLKEAIKDKDHFIKSLTKTSKLRRLVDSDAINTPQDSFHDKLSYNRRNNKENEHFRR